ncbi:fungal-specific transcription factor domain-containing protein [Hypoxylon sp. NC1633]|nr:fungal-specific transcription factor domain-containing protein [Hypoxylon sp. NC1633]
MEGRRGRHCWECRRRYLVCDFTEPACKRCSTFGIECPGYSDVKPTRLKWLAPGTVTSRSRGQRRQLTPPGKTEKSYNDMTSRAMSEPAHTAIDLTLLRFEMCLDPGLIAQGMEYFNSCIYQELLPTCELGPNPRGPMSPDYLRFGMLCMILSHRINKMRNGPQCKALAEKFYLYRGLALRSLSEHLNVEGRRTDDMVIAGILTILLIDIQQGASLNWRCHTEGLNRLIALRGGFRAFAGSSSLQSPLVCLWFVAVIGNTTCPASDLAMTSLQLDALEFLLQEYADSLFPFQMCPLPLFAEIIRTNHLRMQATSRDAFKTKNISKEAYELLERVNDFSPEQWGQSKPSSKEDWMLIGSVYQAAVTLYCILSFQSLSILPTTPALRGCCATHAHRLHILLNEGLSSPKTKRSLLWPLVVLGVEAVHESAAMRAFVSRRLSDLGHDAGIYAPLTAKHVLETFWGSDEVHWDACFDRPYAFTTQIAVDTSGLYSS